MYTIYIYVEAIPKGMQKAKEKFEKKVQEQEDKWHGRTRFKQLPTKLSTSADVRAAAG